MKTLVVLPKKKEAEGVAKTLKTKAISATKWTTASTIIVNGIQVFQTIIFARFLEPFEFGLLAIIMLIINFSQNFKDIGVSNAIIHKQNITSRQFSSIYWLNVFMGFALCFSVIFFAPLISNFYDESLLYNPLILISFSFIIQAFGLQFYSLLQKELRYNVIAPIEIISKSIGFLLSIILVVNKFGIYSILYGTLSSVAIQTLMLLFFGIKVYRPLLHFNLSDLADFKRFGLFQLGERILYYFIYQFDIFLIGKLLGTEALGVYFIAKQIITKPSQIIGAIQFKVSFPLLAKVQNNMEEMKRIYLKIVNYFSSVNFPVYILIAILAEPIVLIFLGDKWYDVIILIRILAFYILVKSIVDLDDPLFLARGRADLGFYYCFILLFYAPIWILFGSKWGLQGVSISLAIMQASLILPNWYFFINKALGVGFREYIKEMFIPLALSLIAGFFSIFLYLIFSNQFIRLFSVISVNLLIYYSICVKCNKSFVYMAKEFI